MDVFNRARMMKTAANEIHGVEPNHEVIVRCAGKVWHISTEQPTQIAQIQTQAVITEPQPRFSHPQWMSPSAWLTLWGCILGTLMVVLCAFGVKAQVLVPETHQESFSRVQTPHIDDRAAIPTKNDVTRLPVNHALEIRIPAIRLYGLYELKASAHVWKLYRVAAYSADLIRFRDEAQGKATQWAIRPLAWNVSETPAGHATSTGAITRVSAWLQTEVSALCALDSSLSDGAPARDAWTAYQTANRVLPQHQYFVQTGQASRFYGFYQLTKEAYVYAARGQVASSESTISAAIEQLGALRSGTGS